MSTAHRPHPIVERLGRSDLIALGREWDRLVADSVEPSPFLAWPWVSAWLDTLGRDADLHVVAARDPADGRLLGMAPFEVSPTRRRGIRYQALRFIATGPLGGRHLDMPIHRDHVESVAPALWDAVSRERRWDLLDLAGLAGDGALARLTLRRRGDRHLVDEVTTHHADLAAEPTETVEPDRGSEWRLVTADHDVTLTIARMARLSEPFHTERIGRAPFAHPSVLGFHREAARRLLDAGRLRLWRLDSNGTTVAALYGIRFDGTVAAYTTVGDPDRAADLVSGAVLAAAEEGARRFLLPPGIESAPVPVVPRQEIRLCRPTGPWGRVLWTGRRVRSAIAALRGRSRGH